jgi:hypothetical protein
VTLSEEQRRMRGRIGGLTAAARGSLDANLTKARLAFLAGFIDAVDPDRVLPMAERERRAEAARRAYFVKLAYRSSVARAAGARASRPPHLGPNLRPEQTRRALLPHPVPEESVIVLTETRAHNPSSRPPGSRRT